MFSLYFKWALIHFNPAHIPKGHGLDSGLSGLAEGRVHVIVL